MRLDITGRHVEITAPLRQLITKRLARLERVLNDAAVSAIITLTKEKYRLRDRDRRAHARAITCCAATAKGTRGRSRSARRPRKLEQQAQTLKGKWDGA